MSSLWIWAFVVTLKDRSVCWFAAAIFVPLQGTPTWHLHTKLYKFGSSIFPNISHMKCCMYLILCEALCIFIFFHFPDLGLSVLNGLHFNLWWHRENRELLTVNEIIILHRVTRQDGPSGFGFELTFRLKKQAGETSPPSWPAELLQSLARYIFQTGVQITVGLKMHCCDKPFR